MTGMTGSVGAGLLMALLLSLISTGALYWAWNKKFFYWVWGGGILGRFLVFAGTAVVVYQFTSLNLVAVLLTLAVATTLFMVVEALYLFSK